MSDRASEEHCFYAGIILFTSFMLFLVYTDEELGPKLLKSKYIQAYSFIIWIYLSETKLAFAMFLSLCMPQHFPDILARKAPKYLNTETAE